MRRTLPLLFAALVLGMPAVALAYVNLRSSDAYLFDIAEPGDGSPVGSILNGTTDAYDTCYVLEVGGSTYSPSGATVRSLGDRQIEMPVETLAGLRVQRLIYVPATGGNYVRFVEVLENPSASSITTMVAVSGNLGSDSFTNLTATSSGDLAVTTADDWFCTDDEDVTGDPSLAHVVQSASATLRANVISLTGDQIRYAWNLIVPAGGRVVLMHFGVQAPDRAAAEAEARRLVGAPDDALVGLDEYLDDIRTFDLTTGGAPRIRFLGASSVDEGAEIVVEASVEDTEGDAFTFSWDLDDDGTFDEAPGETRHTIAAGTTDGPSTVRVGIRAVDAVGNASERYRAIQVQNVPPEVTSTPPHVIGVGGHLRYAIVAVDPAGERDPLTYSVTEGPERMMVSSAGVVTWMATESDVTPSRTTLPIEITVRDDDGGVATHRWEMVVSPNRAPSTPSPAYPIDGIGIIDPTPRLAATNAQDLDLDPLTYHFEIDTVSTFDSPDLRASGPIEEGAGFTAWSIPEPLAENRMYHWRVWADDGTSVSETRPATFYVVRDPRLPPPEADAGPPPRRDAGLIPGIDAGLSRDGGGGCSATGSGASAPSALLGLLALIGLARRRR